MNLPHIIRIRGPWQRLLLEIGDSSSVDAECGESTTVALPSSWVPDVGEKFIGRIKYTRFFNRPTGITELTRIHLAFEKIVGRSVISLNGICLGRIDWPNTSESFDVSGQLSARNLIEVVISSLAKDDVDTLSMPPGGLVGEVRLEIG